MADRKNKKQEQEAKQPANAKQADAANQACTAYENGSKALKQNDLDTAVWEFFKASRSDHGNKEYHQAFADVLRKRGLKPMEEKNTAKAEELFQKALKNMELIRLDMKLEAALLGHLDAAFELRREFIISVWTEPEGKVLTELLLEANCPKTLCAIALNYEYGMGGYPKDKKKALELLENAAAQGYEQAIQTIENIKRSEKEEIRQLKKEKEFAKNNPPLKGAEKKNAEDELIELLRPLVRKATIIGFEKRKVPSPAVQILTSHAGGFPYFEEGGLWPYNTDDDIPYDFIFQVFQDENNSIVLPDGVKLLQLFYDWGNESEFIVFYNKLNIEKAIFVENPFGNSLKYKLITLSSADMLPEFDFLQVVSREAALAAEKIHPGNGWSVYENMRETLKIERPLLDSYLGGYPAEFLDYQTDKKPYKNIQPLFQLYLEEDGVSPFGWDDFYDALLYANYNIKTKKTDTFLRQNYD